MLDKRAIFFVPLIPSHLFPQLAGLLGEVVQLVAMEHQVIASAEEKLVAASAEDKPVAASAVEVASIEGQEPNRIG